MVNTTISIDAKKPNFVPVSYAKAFNNTHTQQLSDLLNKAFQSECEIPAGGAFTTIDDLYRFAEAMRKGGRTDDVRILSPALHQYARQVHTGLLENHAWDFERIARGLQSFPANFNLLGGYTRGTGHYLTSLGLTASSSAFGGVGGGSTAWMVDPERGLTMVFLSAGFMEGLTHLERLCQLADLAVAACT